MVYSVQQIKFEILGYIKEFGGKFDEWYVGIAADPLMTLERHHNVDKANDIWLYKQALSFAACRTLQRFFVDGLHTDGEPVLRGDESMDCVYLYRKSARTVP